MTLLSKRKWVPMIINLSPIDLKRGILLTHAKNVKTSLKMTSKEVTNLSKNLIAVHYIEIKIPLLIRKII